MCFYSFIFIYTMMKLCWCAQVHINKWMSWRSNHQPSPKAKARFNFWAIILHCSENCCWQQFNWIQLHLIWSWFSKRICVNEIRENYCYLTASSSVVCAVHNQFFGYCAQSNLYLKLLHHHQLLLLNTASTSIQKLQSVVVQKKSQHLFTAIQ